MRPRITVKSWEKRLEAKTQGANQIYEKTIPKNINKKSLNHLNKSRPTRAGIMRARKIGNNLVKVKRFEGQTRYTKYNIKEYRNLLQTQNFRKLLKP